MNFHHQLKNDKPIYYFYHNLIIRLFFSFIDYFGFYFFKVKPLIIKPKNKILIINLGGAGDLIISEPLISTLANFSNQKIDLVCLPGQEQSLLNLPCLGQFFYCELPWLGGKKGKWQSFIAWYKLIKILRRENYLVAVDIKGDPTIILLMILAKIPLRIGFSNGGLGFLLTHPFSQPTNIKRFEIDLVLSEAFNITNKEFNRAPILSLPTSIKFLDSSPKKIVVHLGASVQARSWPLINWVELLNLLVIKYQVEIVGNPKDSRALFSLAPELNSLCFDHSNQPWMKTAKIIKGAHLFIGANSGPAHLAAALGCPVLSIFSAANDPAVWAPPNAEIIIFKPSCFKCELNYCSNLSCLKEISPIIVNEHILDILK